ncbi:hypothetical protein GWI33_009597, partial [Rhynchophorus ferrugineus]
RPDRTFQEQNGRGKYATVCRAVHKRTGTHYAAKFVKKRRRNQDQMNEIIHEIAVLMQCSSTNRVIRLHEVYESLTEMVSSRRINIVLFYPSPST